MLTDRYQIKSNIFISENKDTYTQMNFEWVYMSITDISIFPGDPYVAVAFFSLGPFGTVQS